MQDLGSGFEPWISNMLTWWAALQTSRAGPSHSALVGGLWQAFRATLASVRSVTLTSSARWVVMTAPAMLALPEPLSSNTAASTWSIRLCQHTWRHNSLPLWWCMVRFRWCCGSVNKGVSHVGLAQAAVVQHGSFHLVDQALPAHLGPHHPVLS